MEGQYNTRSPAVKRLMREAKELSEATSDYYAQPLSDNLFEWHFTVRGPSDTEFDGGVYHGRIILPPDYPMKPPNIIILTPNGRFETGKKICLSISGYHPETWQPSWSIRTALLALIGFMPTPGQGTIGSLDYTPEERKKLAKRSISFSCEECCPDGSSTNHLLKTREEEQNGGNVQEKLSRAAEAKELAMKMTFKGDEERNETSTQNISITETNTISETTEEKEKRIRKEASKRMQQKFRERLYARTSGMIEQMNAKPHKLPQGNADTPASQTSQSTQNAAVNNGDPSTTGTLNNQAPQPHQQVHQPHGVDGGTNDERSYVDWLIAAIIIAIAAILYRRAATFLNFLPGSVSSTEGDNEDTSGNGFIHSLDDM